MASLAFVKKAVPWIGTAVSLAVPEAAPFVGLASKLLGTGLNKQVPADPDGIANAVGEAMADPAQLPTLKKIDDDFAVQMKQLGIQQIEDLEKISADDRASARAMQVQTRSWLPGALALTVTTGFFGLLAVTAFHTVPEGSEKILDVMTGSLGTAWICIVNYYFGSSAGSDRKTELLAQAPAIPDAK